MNGFMYKVARFFQGRYGIDKLFYGICGVAVVLSAANLFVRSLILQLMVYAVLVLAVVRAMSRNCQKRYEENSLRGLSGELAGNFHSGRESSLTERPMFI